MNEDITSKIHDIKDIVEIPDNSIFIYYGLIFLGFLLSLIIVLAIIKYFKNKKVNQRKIYFDILQNIEFKNSKEDAYTITKYLRLLIKNDREKILANELINELEEYKYKKEVPQISNSIKNKLNTILGIIDV
ncbi:MULTISPECIES: hypothetical protein [Arcobacteraceae]|uniref:Uncharacterized protein n=1 Tax=Poseidonibacter parvus TaxID=1850254 RepID=A0A1P8KK73_9BACT|nr:MULTISPECIES: hypothetical protein [Arcobacteraceae]APW64958.1 hypothetical protein LPB137_03470 [Poseidonibacter parvus]